MKIIAIHGAKFSKKDELAHRLSQNSDCVWIRPYTDREVRIRDEPNEWDEYNHLNSVKLTHKMERDVPFFVQKVNDCRYVYFKYQLNADYVVVIADDLMMDFLKNEYDGEWVSIICHSDMEQPSERFTMQDSEFDFVFDHKYDDYDTLEASVV